MTSMGAKKKSAQETLFELAPRLVEPAPLAPALAELADALPRDVMFGGMSWTYRGWNGHVYAQGSKDKLLVESGLLAYAQHPLLRCVEIDRTYYDPLPASELAAWAAQVPEGFRFVVKAHEDCVVRRYPMHARYGARRGLDNPLYLDPKYAAEAVVAPLVEGLGDKLGALLFQFPPHDPLPGPFARDVHAFLSRLPKGVTYAVEVRNRELLTREYGEALAAAGAIHCHSVWSGMPDVLVQARIIPPSARRPLLIRWLLRADDRYEDARVRFEPFDKLVSEDLDTRARVASLIAKAHAHDVPVVALVDNKAEGCAPASIVQLARELRALLLR